MPTQSFSVYLDIISFNKCMENNHLLCIWKKLKRERYYEELKQESNFKKKGEKKGQILSCFRPQ